MSTYARWVLWVGAEMGWMDFTEASRHTDEILDQIRKGKPYERDGLKIQYIYMHGEEVGLGVEVVDLHWTDKLDDKNVFDSAKIKEAEELISKVDDILASLGITAKIVVRHHVDLGG